MDYKPENEMGLTATTPITEDQEMTLDQLIDEMAKLKLAEKAVLRLTDFQRKALERVAELQSKMATEPLTNLEADQLNTLKDVVRTGEPPPSYVYLDDLLLKKVGPEAFKRIKLRRSELEADTAALKASNDELQRQIETINKPLDVPKGPLFNPGGMTAATTPGTYVVEVAASGIVTNAYLITPKEAEAYAKKIGFFAKIANFFKGTT